MTDLELLRQEDCRWDLVALGEIMLRFDPGDERIETTRTFRVWEGGGEYNVARGLGRCFGMRSAIVTALVDNPIGRLIDDLVSQGGVERAQLNWVPFDGVGRRARNGLNFTERGYGVRAALGVSDRGHSAASQLQAGDVDWERIFSHGVRWFHTGGIFCALSDTSASVALEAIDVARAHGAVVSYDLNYRPSLWKDIGGTAQAAAVNRQIVEKVDVLVGNEEDFAAALGFELEGVDEDLLDLDPALYDAVLGRVLDALPQVKLAAATLRQVRTATTNDWTAVCRSRSGFHLGPELPGLEIYDRVGGGDSFASGLFYGLLQGHGIERALAYGVAHGALAMTTPGDTSMATLAEVERLVAGSAARVER